MCTFALKKQNKGLLGEYRIACRFPYEVCACVWAQGRNPRSFFVDDGIYLNKHVSAVGPAALMRVMALNRLA